MTMQKSLAAAGGIIVAPLVWAFFGLPGLLLVALTVAGAFAGPKRSMATAAGVVNASFRLLVGLGKFALVIFALACIVELIIAAR